MRVCAIVSENRNLGQYKGQNWATEGDQAQPGSVTFDSMFLVVLEQIP